MTEDQFDSTARRDGSGLPGGLPSPGGAPAASPATAEEQAIRLLMHRAVDGLQPSPDALPRIRRAVPARRARYRQAWTGAAVIAVLTAAAVPGLPALGGLQLSDGAAAGPPRAASAAGTSAVLSPSSDDDYPLPGISRAAYPAATATAGTATAVPSGAAVLPSADSSGSGLPAGTVPDCLRVDLGRGSAVVGTPDSIGRLYGIFTAANVSGHACGLADPGSIAIRSGNGQVRVVSHIVGDQAIALPNPATLTARVLLAPGGSYQLFFAWVPDALCPTASAAASASSGPGPSVSGTPSASVGSSPSDRPASPASGDPATAGAGPSASAAPVAPTPAASPSAAAAGSPSAATATPAPSPTGPATLIIGHGPLGGPDVAVAAITGVCGSGTVYRSLPQPL